MDGVKHGVVNLEGSTGQLRELALFAGAGGGILGGLLLGWRTVCAVEVNPYAASVLAQRQNDGILAPFPIWDDVRTFDGKPWRGRVDVVSGGFPCFIAGTFILTERGHVPIEQVEVGDLVLTHRGRWRPVTSVMHRDNAPLVCVTGTGIPGITCTPEHPFYARSLGRVWDNDARRYRRAVGHPQWTDASNMQGHFAAQILPPESDDERSKEFWWLVGRYLADGWRVDRAGRKNGRVVICANNSKADELEKRIADCGFVASRVKERTVNKFHITIGWLYEFLGQFGRYAHGKRIPGWVFSLGREKSASLLDGYMSGDGWESPTGNRNASTTSKALALGISLLAQRAHGIVSGVYTIKSRAGHRIEGRPVVAKPAWHVRICATNNSSFIDGACGWKRVRRIEPAGEGRVYNISVADDESYCADGAVVHNCTDISSAGKGAGIDGENSGLWREMARIIREVGPRFVFVENSPRLTSRGLGRVLGDLAELGFDAEWGVLGAHHVGAPHDRNRIWIVAYANGDGRERADVSLQPWGQKQTSAESVGCGKASDAGGVGLERPIHLADGQASYGRSSQGRAPAGRALPTCWERDCPQPGLLGLDDGVADWKQRIEAAGNGQVPIVAALAWRTLAGRIGR